MFEQGMHAWGGAFSGAKVKKEVLKDGGGGGCSCGFLFPKVSLGGKDRLSSSRGRSTKTELRLKKMKQ